jgi:hypothetical protein
LNMYLEMQNLDHKVLEVDFDGDVLGTGIQSVVQQLK